MQWISKPSIQRILNDCNIVLEPRNICSFPFAATFLRSVPYCVVLCTCKKCTSICARVFFLALYLFIFYPWVSLFGVLTSYVSSALAPFKCFRLLQFTWITNKTKCERVENLIGGWNTLVMTISFVWKVHRFAWRQPLCCCCCWWSCCCCCFCYYCVYVSKCMWMYMRRLC